MAVAIWSDDLLQSLPKTCWKVAKLSSSDAKNWPFQVISTGMLHARVAFARISHIFFVHQTNFKRIFAIHFPNRNKVKYLSYLRKRCNVNPARGPFHFRAPCRVFYKAVRGTYSIWLTTKIIQNRIANENLMMINYIYLHYLM